MSYIPLDPAKIYTPLDDTLADLANIRIKRNDKTNETAIIGVDFNMLRHLITTARLYHYEHPYTPKTIDSQSSLKSVEQANAVDSWTCHYAATDVLEHLGWLFEKSARPEYVTMMSPVSWKRKSRKRTPSPAYEMKNDPKPARFTRFAWLPVPIRRMKHLSSIGEDCLLPAYDFITRWVWLKPVTFTRFPDNKTVVAWEHHN